MDCGDKAAAWICKVLQQEGLRLNYSAPSLAKRLSCKVFKAWKTEVHDDDEVIQIYIYRRVFNHLELETKVDKFANSVDTDEVALDELTNVNASE